MPYILDKYKSFLDNGTYDGADWSRFSKLPLSRYHTFKQAFQHFEKVGGKIIVELGTSRSFVHGGLVGCNSDDKKYWTPDQPQNWDWGAGGFTRMAAESLYHLNPTIHTVDLIGAHIERCKHITSDFAHIIQYHIASSLDYLQSLESETIDLLYLDTGDMTPIEPTAQLQLAEAKIIVERNLLSKNGILLIDDVRNQTPKKFGEECELGKSKYSIPYLLANGFEIIVDEYQVLMQKKI